MAFTNEEIFQPNNYFDQYDARPTYIGSDGVIQVGVYEVAYFFYCIPDGCVTTWDDVEHYFDIKYGRKTVLRLSKQVVKDEIPYWKAVSTRGYLMDYGIYYGKNKQKRRLESIGIEIDEKNRVVDFKNRHFKGDCEQLRGDLAFGMNTRTNLLK